MISFQRLPPLFRPSQSQFLPTSHNMVKSQDVSKRSRKERLDQTSTLVQDPSNLQVLRQRCKASKVQEELVKKLRKLHTLRHKMEFKLTRAQTRKISNNKKLSASPEVLVQPRWQIKEDWARLKLLRRSKQSNMRLILNKQGQLSRHQPRRRRLSSVRRTLLQPDQLMKRSTSLLETT